MKKLIILLLLILSITSYSQDVRVYPNPVNSGRNLNIISKYPITNVKIFNMEGKRININFKTLRNSLGNPLASLSYSFINDLPSGFYIVQVTTEKGVTNKKIIML